ncbi:MAG: porin family protein [Pseudomonadota bacterium]
MKKIALALIIASVAAPSLAENKFTGELLLGKASQELNISYSFNNEGVIESGKESFDNDSNGYGFRAGYQIGQHFAVELTHQLYGEYTNSFLDDFDDRIRETIEAKATSVGVKGILPMSDSFSIVGRLGLANWDLDLSSTDSSNPGEVFKLKEDGQDLYYSIGAEFKINEKFFAGIEYSILTMSWDDKVVDGEFSASVDYEHEVNNLGLSFGMVF